MTYRLLDAVTADTTGASFEIKDGMPCSLMVYSSDFGGGTVTFQISPDGTNWIIPKDAAGNNATYTASSVVGVDFLTVGMFVRAILAGSEDAAALSVKLSRMGGTP